MADPVSEPAATAAAAGNASPTTTTTNPVSPISPISPDTAQERAEIKKFYNDHGLKFECFDAETGFKNADAKIRDPRCHNLVVDFGVKNAYVASDIEGKEGARNLLKTKPNTLPHGVNTRWIAIFSPHRQREFVETLLKPYGLSPRHEASLISPPGRGNLEIAQKLWHWFSVEYGEKFFSIGYNSLHNVLSKRALRKARTMDINLDPNMLSRQNSSGGDDQAPLAARLKSMFSKKKSDVESGLPLRNIKSNGTAPTASNTMRSHATDDNESVADFRATTDRMRRRFRPRRRSRPHGPTSDTEPDLDALDDITDSDDSDIDFEDGAYNKFSDVHYHPRMLRLWIWIFILDDGTVVSLHEPVPQLRDSENHSLETKDVLGHVRRNFRTILRCLTKHYIPTKVKDVVQGDIERSLEKGALILRHSPEGASDLLFYYLFDDWYSSWSLAVDRAHPYSKILTQIRESEPELKHIDDLHDAIQRLSSLKRVYQSYDIIIGRILQRSGVKEGDNGWKLNASAISRFERLKERITYLAITEIEDCEKEAQGLVSLTYNRLNFRETKAVERLTLLTVALAKVTIVFLPLSLIVGFFSMQVEGITDRYNDKVFWGSSGIALLVTLAFLLILGGFSGTVESVRGFKEVIKAWNASVFTQNGRDKKREQKRRRHARRQKEKERERKKRERERRRREEREE